VAAALARTAALLREDLDVLDRLAAAELAGLPAGADLSVSRVAGLPDAVRRRVLRGWLREAAIPDLQSVHLRQVDALLTRWHGQGRVGLPGGAGVVRASGRLVVQLPGFPSRTPAAAPDPPEEPAP
jgi:tRNA(Ile)-lysidine synthase